MAAAKSAFLAIAGPSGVGKGTLLAKLFESFKPQFELSVSYTTRAPRPGEVDGKHYNFRSKEEISERVSRGEFLEHAHVHGNIYGTTIAEVHRINDLNKVCVLEIDVQGINKVHASSLGDAGRYVIIRPPSSEELERRLRGRGTEDEETVLKRLNNAVSELEALGQFPADLVIVNDDIDRAFNELSDNIKTWFPHLFNTTSSSVQSQIVQPDEIKPRASAVATADGAGACCIVQ